MEIPKHTCLAVPSVQIQLLIGLQLWSEKEGQSLSRLKASQVTGMSAWQVHFPASQSQAPARGSAG